ncbi:MAG TPA: error-prone DNA polymerase [Halieaceae bacterium]|nr:error-prone DNA polymerase [Halieaceae bacterium]
MPYCELSCTSNYSFLRGASHPEELVERAAELGYGAIAITDECSLAGVVKAHIQAKLCDLPLIIGSELNTREGVRLIALAPNRIAYAELSGLISRARRRANKGDYEVHLPDIIFHLKNCLLLWLPDRIDRRQSAYGLTLSKRFNQRLWLGFRHLLAGETRQQYQAFEALSQELNIPMVACGDVRMHIPQRKALHDALTALKHNTQIDRLGTLRLANSQQYLRPQTLIHTLYPQPLIDETERIARQCEFSLDELRYEYPEEVVPAGLSAPDYLHQEVFKGVESRWPNGAPSHILERIETELSMIAQLRYEHYFLTVYDIVNFAKQRRILCQGRGSAANSVVCYCLGITEVSPEHIDLLFERFISQERDEPPDIDVDFEHERREEVIQYIYDKYSRRRAALAATVITYRTRSAIRDIGRAMGLDHHFIEQLSQSIAWWDRRSDLQQRFTEQGLKNSSQQAEHFQYLVNQILGFPRHLSQHVGGFVISAGPMSHLVPVENASMPNRTVIQWDKNDIEALGLLKVDVLALGMLSAIRKSLDLVSRYQPTIEHLRSIPQEDAATYRMLQQGDSLGVFQIESRAQMAMLPRLKPACFYDLVIEIAIVRPGPIQGEMVHPYLRRREGLEPVSFPNEAIQHVLKRTLGVPIFQEQVIRLAMVAAGFSGGEADQLRRAITNWGKNSKLLTFEHKLVQGMLANGYDQTFAKQLFDQIKGFGGYGFPESHSASFALLAYASAWLKCHHPGAFYVGILNSQPMGFYSPSQLIQDAQRHGITIDTIDINHSQWDHQLIASDYQSQPTQIRLGLRLIKGLSYATAQNLVESRRRYGPYKNVSDLQTRTQMAKNELQALSASDALHSISGHRYQTQWEAMGIEPNRPLLKTLDADVKSAPQSWQLEAPSIAENVIADYQTTGLTLRQHPLMLLRENAPFNRCSTHQDLLASRSNKFVRIAGLVTCKQRPGTASGVIFLTLEDETGNHNVVVWPSLQTRCRQALMNARLLVVKGTLERRDSVCHIIAGDLQDYTHELSTLVLKSRAFR